MALHTLDAVPSDRSSLPLHQIEPTEGFPDSFRLMEFGLLDLNFLASFPHRHGFHSLLLIESGHGFHVIDFQKYSLEPPCLFFLSPGQAHYWRLDQAPSGKIVGFKPDFLSGHPSADVLYEFDCFHGILASPFLRISLEQHQLLSQLLGLMEHEYLSHSPGAELNLRSCLAILLTWAKRWFESARDQQSTPPEAMLIRRFMGLVSENFLEQRAVSFSAETRTLSPGHLHELVKQATRSAPGRIIRDQVLLDAKRLLAHTDLSIAEVGYRLIFEDPAYFSRFFRRETGLAPGDFRRQALEKYQQF